MRTPENLKVSILINSPGRRAVTRSFLLAATFKFAAWSKLRRMSGALSFPPPPFLTLADPEVARVFNSSSHTTVGVSSARVADRKAHVPSVVVGFRVFGQCQTN